jgi:hypothetical protein
LLLYGLRLLLLFELLFGTQTFLELLDAVAKAAAQLRQALGSKE